MNASEPQAECAAPAASGDELLALYRELLSTYCRLYALARGQDYEQIAREAQRTRELVRLLEVASRRTAGSQPPTGSPERLQRLWSETVQAITQIVEMRERVLERLDRSVDEAKEALASLGRGRAALGAYRSPQGRGPRTQGYRV